MADEKETPTPEELAKWDSLKEVFETLVEYFTSPSATRELILRRLRDGVIAAYARRVSVNRGSKGNLLDRIVPVPTDVWGKLADNGFNSRDNVWVNGDLTHTDHGNARLGSTPNTFVYCGIRLHPDWRKELLPKEAVTPAADIPPETKGPTVSQAALKAWFEAYQIAFPDNADTEATAVASAQGCFPGKSVSREAIRRLRGEKKRGRKTQSAK